MRTIIPTCILQTNTLKCNENGKRSKLKIIKINKNNNNNNVLLKDLSGPQKCLNIHIILNNVPMYKKNV